jgi:hypothetical protein
MTNSLSGVTFDPDTRTIDVATTTAGNSAGTFTLNIRAKLTDYPNIYTDQNFDVIITACPATFAAGTQPGDSDDREYFVIGYDDVAPQAPYELDFTFPYTPSDCVVTEVYYGTVNATTHNLAIDDIGGTDLATWINIDQTNVRL